MKPQAYRCFVGIFPPQHILETILETQSRLKSSLDPLSPSPKSSTPLIRWSIPSQWHITLAFLGNIPIHHIEPLRAALKSVASQSPAPHLHLDKFGAFPSLAHARILWLGSRTPSPHLLLLAQSIQEAAANFSTHTPENTFHPHVTLARLKHPLQPSPFLHFSPPDWIAHEFSLVRTQPSPGGSTYTTLLTCKFTDAA